MRIINSTFVSLDGVVNHMEQWHFDFLSEDGAGLALQQLKDAESLLMGRRTYDTYASAWPGREGEYADRINAMPKLVASSTLEDPSWNETVIVGGDLEAEITALKSGQRGDILMHGFGPVARTLVRAGLLDELHLWYHPVLAGVGGPGDVLLEQGLDARFETTGVQVLSTGIVVMSMIKR